MAEGRDLTDQLIDEEAPGPSPGWKVTPEEPPASGRDLTPELATEPPHLPPPPEPRRGPLSDLPWYVKVPAAGVVSTIGGGSGAAIGGALGSAVPIVGTAAGGMTGYLAGNAGARWLNVKLGLEEPGLVGDVLSVALPAAFKGGGALFKSGVRNAPGAAVVRHEMAEEMLTGTKGLGQRLKPAMASDDLYAAAAQHTPDIPAYSLGLNAIDLIREETKWLAQAPSLHNKEVLALAQDMQNMVLQYRGKLPMHELDGLRKRVGLMIKQASSENWIQKSGLDKVYAGIMDDLERAVAAQVPGAGFLRQAIAATRTEKALDTLTDLWSPGSGIQAVEGNVTQVMGKRIQQGFNRLMQDDRVFRESFSPAERLDIARTLETVARYAPGGSPLSTGRFANAMHVAALGGGALTGWNRKSPELGVLTAVGIEALPAILAMAMTRPEGRAAIRIAMQEHAGILTNEAVAFIAATVRAGLAATEPEQPQPGPSGGPWETQAAPGGPARRAD